MKTIKRIVVAALTAAGLTAAAAAPALAGLGTNHSGPLN
jgi:type IV secretory pathway protease TraF